MTNSTAPNPSDPHLWRDGEQSVSDQASVFRACSQFPQSKYQNPTRRCKIQKKERDQGLQSTPVFLSSYLLLSSLMVIMKLVQFRGNRNTGGPRSRRCRRWTSEGRDTEPGTNRGTSRKPNHWMIHRRARSCRRGSLTRAFITRAYFVTTCGKSWEFITKADIVPELRGLCFCSE